MYGNIFGDTLNHVYVSAMVLCGDLVCPNVRTILYVQAHLNTRYVINLSQDTPFLGLRIMYMYTYSTQKTNKT